MILGSRRFTRRRLDADETIAGSVQPEGGQDTTRERRRIWTRAELRVANPETATRADQVILAGVVYDVLQVKHWDSVLAHYEALAEREGEAVVTVSTPTAAPTVDLSSGATSTNAATDTVTTAYAKGVALSIVDTDGGAYQQAGLQVEMKCDELTVPPTTDSTLTHDGISYAVQSVTRDERRLVWVLVGRATP